METVQQYLEEAQQLIANAERQGRGFSQAERARAEYVMKRVGDLRDAEALKKAIQDMNGSLNIASGGGGGFGSAVISSGWDLKSRPSVEVPVASILTKASFPAVGEWAPVGPTTVPLGQDKRFLYPHLPTTNVEGASSVHDFKQSARTLTGTVKRALDATSDKANVDVTLALVTENLSEFAVTINDVPNAILESIELMRQFLNTEGRFQVEKALDAHVFAQIVAGSPPFGTSGADLIAKIRNGVATMRATGANPTVVVLNPTDAASLDLSADAGGYVFPTRDSGSGSPLWGLRVIERTSAAGNEPPYLIDPQMLGMLYLGSARFDADPFTGFKKNLTTLRVEVKGLFHVRNADGARRIAAT